MDPVGHFQMPYDDKERVAAFYRTVFGWGTQDLGPEMGEYVLATTTDPGRSASHTGGINGGFFRNPPERQHTSVVIYVSEIGVTMKKVHASGGKMNSEPMEIPGVGKFATFTDTEGNSVGILEPLPGQ